jgi:hypothetical protein
MIFLIKVGHFFILSLLECRVRDDAPSETRGYGNSCLHHTSGWQQMTMDNLWNDDWQEKTHQSEIPVPVPLCPPHIKHELR